MPEPLKQDSKVGLEQELYKKNVELDFANRIFALTRELYAVSLLNSSPGGLAERFTAILCDKLQLEISSIFVFKQKEDVLEPLVFTKSERTISALRKLGFMLRDIKITEASKRATLKDVFDGKSFVTSNLSDIWGGLVSEDDLKVISTSANIKSILLFPLLTEDKFIGVLLFGFHLEYKDLPELEREALHSFSDIVAVALDKAYVYRKLDEVNQGLVSANVELLKANEELKTIDATKSAILSNASHHLQNPLQNIVMGTSMLMDGSYGALTPEAKKTVAQIFESARHLTITFKMWVKALDFENGRVEYKTESFDLGDLVEKTIVDWKVSAKERGLEVSYENDGHTPYTINGDKEWLREVVVNIVDNALNMTEKGFIKIKVEKFGVEKIRLSVTDSGVGITKETMTHLFGKLEKGKEGWKKDINGTGLGLYISKKIIEEGHHGTIWAESKGADRGATFFVEIPVG
ncbi:MAG: PAS/PAC sensor signal transduction histidine kinase [Candidatus Nomurabacteria bacterium GW2011_GWA2_40_9]|uniref:histidine kinase n=1 Tax=Candidatus Nomurabacteria bacterium GW2011_GWA2_40_9 TaxID=1618734 RepID=A0A0G0TXD8_9BACT|nr:MAG: PAS/PAC sensor signal transduction histidine kinase [Candidatus Nomurabacteria bacterium GW2011_GWA2_40_9]